MPTTPLPPNLTKVSFILDKKEKLKLERAAKRAKCSMSALISQALDAFYSHTKKATAA